MPENLIKFTSNPDYGNLIAFVLLVLLVVVSYYFKLWLKSIDNVRDAVFGSHTNRGLKDSVSALFRLNDEQKEASTILNQKITQVVLSVENLTAAVSQEQKEMSEKLGVIEGQNDVIIKLLTKKN